MLKWVRTFAAAMPLSQMPHKPQLHSFRIIELDQLSWGVLRPHFPSKVHAGATINILAFFSSQPLYQLAQRRPLLPRGLAFPSRNKGHNLFKALMLITTLSLCAERERISLLLKSILMYNLTTVLISTSFSTFLRKCTIRKIFFVLT